jgi:hypothetical protein
MDGSNLPAPVTSHADITAAAGTRAPQSADPAQAWQQALVEAQAHPPVPPPGGLEPATAAPTRTQAVHAFRATLPNAAHAQIPSGKLTGYALNPGHPVGGNKARVLTSVLGFDQSNAGALARLIKDGVTKSPAQPGKADAFGQRYTVDVPCQAGAGTIRTAWIIKPGSDIPWLTTIFVKLNTDVWLPGR